MSSRWLLAKTAIVRVFCATLAWVLLPRTLAFAEPALALSWRSPGQCPTDVWARKRIEVQLGRDPFANASTTLQAQVEIVADHDRFRLKLTTTVRETHGERDLEDKHCEQLAEAATLMIALAIDANAALEAETQTDGAAPALRASDSEKPPSLQRNAPSSPVSGSAPLFAHARAAAAMDVGFLPAPGAGMELAVGLHGIRFASELAGMWLPKLRSRGEQRVAVGMWAGVWRSCLQRKRQRFLLGGCLGAELGRVSADGVGLAENLRKRSLYLALSAGARTRLHIAGSLWLALDVGLALPYFRQRFVTRDTADGTLTVLHTTQPINARGSLGLELSF